MTSLLLAAALAAAEWSGYWHEQIERATLAVAGEVVGFRPHGENNLAARLRVERVLKGETGGRELLLPFKTRLLNACDFEIRYELGKKYLLLIDDREDFRLVWFPDYPQIEIPDYEAAEVRFTRAVVDPAKRILDLEPMLRHRRGSRRLEVMAFVSTLTREVVRPLLPALRRELGEELRAKIDRARPEDRAAATDEMLMSTFDLSLVEEIRRRPEPFRDPFVPTTRRRERGEDPVQTLSRIIGRPYSSMEALRAAWPVALRRARAEGRPEALPDLVRRLGADDPSERAAAEAGLLDLGPGVREALRSGPKPSDPEARARLEAILRELEFLEDLRSGG